MQKYKDLDHDSGVSAFEIGQDWIKVQFKNGSIYLYNFRSSGQRYIEQMKNLATYGDGLNAYINKNVKKLYAAKLS